MPDAPPPAQPLHPAAALGCGLLMGTADAVPGVSGGTMALILGIYERFLAAIAAVLGVLRAPLSRPAWASAVAGLRLLVPLGIGLVSALVTMVILLVGAKPVMAGDPDVLRAALAAAPGLLINPGTAPYVFALFFGVVLASVAEPWRRCATRRAVDWASAAVGAILAAGLALMPALGASPTPPMLVLGGAVAIAVMLLPGVSGSLALLVLGLYQPVAGALHARDFATLAWFIAGVGAGAAAMVPALRWLLARWHDRTMPFLTGLMAGSLVALWPWKAHYYPEAIPVLGPMAPQAPDAGWPGVLAAAAVGVVLVWLLARLARRAAGHDPAAAAA